MTTRAERRETRAARRVANGQGAPGIAAGSAPGMRAAPAPPTVASRSAAQAFASISTARAPGVRVAPWSPHAPAPPPPRQPHASSGSTATAAPPPHEANGAAAPPAPTLFDGASGNAQQQHVRTQEQRQYARAGAPIPQGEVQLVHSWAHVIYDRQWDPKSCTIWLLAQGPEPYEFYIPGVAAIATAQHGQQPTIALYEAVMRNRRLPDRAEHFVGRIECPSTDGRMMTIGGGLIAIPPAPPQTAQPAWSPPQAPNPYGPPNPYAPPPGYGAPNPYAPPGYPPYWPGMPGMAPGMIPYFTPPQQPPASVANNPQQMDVWIKLQESQARMRLEELKYQREIEANRAPPPAAQDPWVLHEKIMQSAKTFADLQPKPEAPHRGLTIHNVDGDKIVETKDGDIDAVSTGILSVGKELRTMVRSRAQAAAAAAQKTNGNGGAGPGVSTASPPGVKNGRH